MHILYSCVQDSTGFSPVFLLFLDCVRQLMEEYPTAFEFTELYLTALWESALTGLVSEFAFDSIAQRRDAFRANAFASASSRGHIASDEAIALAMADSDSVRLRSTVSSSLSAACGLRELVEYEDTAPSSSTAAASSHLPRVAATEACPLDEAYQLAAHLSCAFHVPTRYRFDDARFVCELERLHCNQLHTVFDADRMPYIEHLVQSSLISSPIDSFLIDPSAPYRSQTPDSSASQENSLSILASVSNSPSFNELHHELLLDVTAHPLRVRVWDELFSRWVAQLWPVPSLHEPANPQLRLVAQRLCHCSRQTRADYPEHSIAAQPHMQLFTGPRLMQIGAMLCDAVRLGPPTPTMQKHQVWSQIDDPSPSLSPSSSPGLSQAVTPSPSFGRFTSAVAVVSNRATAKAPTTSPTSNSSSSTLTPSPAHTPLGPADVKLSAVKQVLHLPSVPPKLFIGSSKSPRLISALKCASNSDVMKYSASTSSGVSTEFSSVRAVPPSSSSLVSATGTEGGGSFACHSDSAGAEPLSIGRRQGSLVKQRVSEFMRQGSVPSVAPAAAAADADGSNACSSVAAPSLRALRQRRVDDSAPSVASPEQLIRKRTSPSFCSLTTAAARLQQQRRAQADGSPSNEQLVDANDLSATASAALRVHCSDSPRLHQKRPVPVPLSFSSPSPTNPSPFNAPPSTGSPATALRNRGDNSPASRPLYRSAAAANSATDSGLCDAANNTSTPTAPPAVAALQSISSDFTRP